MLTLHQSRDLFCHGVCSEVRSLCQNNNSLSDLEFHCKDGGRVKGNQIILASVSSWIKTYLIDRASHGHACDSSVIFLVPDFSHSQISGFVNAVYQAFAKGEDDRESEAGGLVVPTDIAAAFGLGGHVKNEAIDLADEEANEAFSDAEYEDESWFQDDGVPCVKEEGEEDMEDEDPLVTLRSKRKPSLRSKKLIKPADRTDALSSLTKPRQETTSSSVGRRAVRQSARKVVTYAEGEEETEANEDISENGGDDEQNGEDDCANLDDEDFESDTTKGRKRPLAAVTESGEDMLNTPVPKRRSRKREKPGPPTPGRPTREMMEQMKGEFDTNAIAKLRDLMKNNGKAEDGDDSCSADGNHVFAGVTVVDDAQVGDRRRLGRIIKKAYFRAIWGVKASSTTGKYVGRPLTWSEPEPAEIERNFEEVTKIYQAFYGFSKSQLMFTNVVLNKMDENSSEFGVRLKDKAFKENKKRPKEKLQALLEELDCELKALEQGTSGRSEFGDFLHDDSISLELDPKMAQDDFNNLAVLLWFDNGLKLYPIPPKPSADYCLRLLLDTWCTYNVRLKKNPFLLEAYTKVAAKYKAREAVDKLLNSEPMEKMCPICGKMRPYMTKGNREQFGRHLKAHEREAMDCGCDIVFESPTEKKKHVMLHHSDGKFAGCDRCSWVGYKNSLQNHVEAYHKEYICDICGKTTTNQVNMYAHKQNHQVYNCEICDTSITGLRRYKAHVEKDHGDSSPCEDCGKIFDTRNHMLKHKLHVHRKNEDMPHQCKECNKGFADSTKLKSHTIMHHTNETPHSCRHGCGEAFNNIRKRARHEKKFHGGLWVPQSELV